MAKARPLLVALTLMAAVAGSQAARGDIPAPEQGWWSATNISAVNINPLPSVALPTPVDVPIGPDVPTNGLLVEGGTSATAPLAYSALIYNVPDGQAASQVKLTVATSASAPTATVEVCPLVNPAFTAVEGGPIASAPGYDCSTLSTTAAADSSLTTYTLDVKGMDSFGTLGIAILPATTSDRVVFAQPAAGSLVTVPAAATSSSAQTPEAAAPAAAPTAAAASASPTVAAAAPSSAAVPGTAAAAAPPAAVQPLPASAALGAAPAADPAAPSVAAQGEASVSAPASASGDTAAAPVATGVVPAAVTPAAASSTTAKPAGHSGEAVLLLAFAVAALILWMFAGSHAGAEGPPKPEQQQ